MREWDKGASDLDLLLLAVQHGVLNDQQVEDCLRELEAREGHAEDGTLHTIVLSKGYLTQQRIRELASAPRAADPAATAIRIEVVLACLDCSKEQTFSLEAALRKPRCPACSGTLRFRKQAGAAVKSFAGPLPEDVRKAMGDPQNRCGKYVLLSKLGAGGMGEVFRAWDTVLQRAVALKFPKTVGEDDIRRLYLEAQGAGGLSHPNIASIYEIAEADGRHYIAMQFIPGKTVEDKVKEGADAREIARWVRDAARGVHYAHERGVIHRDLKPANFMIDPDGRVFVMDFGLAKLNTGGGATMSGVILGTPSFMAPEQAAGNTAKISRLSDVYSLGVTLYLLVTGKRPFDGETVTDILVKIITTDPPTLRQASPSAAWELEAIVARAMSRDPAGRYPSAQEMADDLDRFLANEPIHARRPGIIFRAKRVLRRHRGAVLTLIACAILMGAGLLALRPWRQPPGAGADRLKAWSALFDAFRAAMTAEDFRPEVARERMARIEREFPEQKRNVDSFVDSESADLIRSLAALPRARWLESRPQARRAREWLEFARKPTSAADRILAYRGTFALTICVAPYAEVRGPFVAALAVGDRFTPLHVGEVEISDGPLELHHPQFGTRTLPLPALRDGAKYVVEGDWKNSGSLQMKEAP